MRVATWNVNSLRARLPHLLGWLAQAAPDVVGVQETKCTDEQFPFSEIEAAGYTALHHGQKTYNGVALLVRAGLAAEDPCRGMACFADEQSRVIAATVAGVRMVNVYVVNGQSVGSDKYAYKLRWLAGLREYLAGELARHPRLLVTGDYNIAPADADVHDPAAWAGQVLCSEPERAEFRGVLGLGLQDAFRLFEQPHPSYTWWDYRQAAFRRNLGLRIDHILVTPALAAEARRCWIDLDPRRLERPSDHAPVLLEIGS
ncbi:MAG TPA: exodeoxyribonuclease III [Solimonas sp.]|nr:exodeoxyribonuclease III [Solimonas sp.]